MAIRYELGNGKTVILKEEDFLLSDEKFQLKLQNLLADNMGVEVFDPFTDFKIKDFKGFEIPDLEKEIEELPQEIIEKIKREFDEKE